MKLAGVAAKISGAARMRFEDFRMELATVTTPQLAAKMLPLDLRSAELSELLAWLQEARAPQAGLDGLRAPQDFSPIGCKTFEWFGNRFSVVCYYDRKRGVHLSRSTVVRSRMHPPRGSPG